MNRPDKSRMRLAGITSLVVVCCATWSTAAIADGTTFSTVISAAGALVRGSEVQTSTRNSAGNYRITFKREINACSFVAGVVGTQSGLTSARLLSAKVVQVFTFSATGAAADRSFTLLASCDGGLRPVQGELVINEVMANPTGSETQEEWFELFNPTQKTITLNGLTVSTATTSQTITCSATVAPGAFALFARSTNPVANGNLPAVDCAFALTLVNTGGALNIKRGSLLIDAVDFTGTSWLDGKALSLDPSASNTVANDTLANWCFNQQSQYSASGFGTPKSVNPACL